MPTQQQEFERLIKAHDRTDRKTVRENTDRLGYTEIQAAELIRRREERKRKRVILDPFRFIY